MYSPPPLDGFSPPPMSDVSPLREYPPPINGFSDSGDDEEDLDYDFPIEDAEYDLTGLSDKLKSIEIDKISNLPPREILELQKENSEVKNLCINGVPFQENGFACEPPSIISDNKEAETNTVLQSDVVTEDCERVNSPEPPEVLLVNGGDSKETGEDKFCPVLNNELKEESCQEESRPGAAETDTSPVPSEDYYDKDFNYAEKMEPEEPSGNNGSEPPENCMAEKCEDTTNQEECISPSNNSTVNACDPDFGDFGDWTTGQETCGEEEGWGNFDSGPDQGAETTQDWGQPPTSDHVSHEAPLQFDDSDEDEFGDFGEADNSVKLVEEQTMKVSDSSTIVKTLETLSEASAQLLLSVFVPLGDLDEEIDQLSLDNVVMEENGIFESISNPASCPALNHQWRDSAAHKVIMETLGIDSRVLVSDDSLLSLFFIEFSSLTARTGGAVSRGTQPPRTRRP